MRNTSDQGLSLKPYKCRGAGIAPPKERQQKLIANVVGVDAHIDPQCIEEITQKCRDDFNRPLYEEISKNKRREK